MATLVTRNGEQAIEWDPVRAMREIVIPKTAAAQAKQRTIASAGARS